MAGVLGEGKAAVVKNIAKSSYNIPITLQKERTKEMTTPLGIIQDKLMVDPGFPFSNTTHADVTT